MLCMATFAAMVVDSTFSAHAGSERDDAQTSSRPATTPHVVIIALAQQRISVYGATGKIVEAPVSTGSPGYETPAGIYGVLDKEEHHHSKSL
jgi:hypothetical protein